MSDAFFKLKNEFKTITSNDEFINQLKISEHLSNIQYEPLTLTKNDNFPKLKIRNKNFTNVSFSKTKIFDVNFYNCSFNDCLFIGTEIENCEFHKCKFKNVNTYKIKISDTYIDPKSFINNFKLYKHSNIATHLFHQLLNNSDEEVQNDFKKIAKYHFLKWENRQRINTVIYEIKKKKVSSDTFLNILKYLKKWIFKWSFGYGLKLRHLLTSSFLMFSIFLLINNKEWKSYDLKSGITTINSFNSDSSNFVTNIYYTLDNTTRLVNSSIRPTSEYGFIWLAIQSIFGFVFLSLLITIIINKFVK